ncbi:hypothetical protein CLV41_101657 [Roseibium marinum]|uniref:Uncharacterized protein n=1 Tax=Roseibium marinum TaxID=281252 RepID=A0A2S3V2S5_9HYPH|nr:hypothetical protein CLV41_101657 [Roseibium marinum]
MAPAQGRGGTTVGVAHRPVCHPKMTPAQGRGGTAEGGAPRLAAMVQVLRFHPFMSLSSIQARLIHAA